VGRRLVGKPLNRFLPNLTYKLTVRPGQRLDKVKVTTADVEIDDVAMAPFSVLVVKKNPLKV
jgi:hypothetical protein